MQLRFSYHAWRDRVSWRTIQVFLNMGNERFLCENDSKHFHPAFPNQYRRKVLGLLLMRPDQQIHLRELARVIGAAPGTLKKELDALGEFGLLRAERVGNQVRFCANTAHPVFPELQALIRKTIGLADALRLSLVRLPAGSTRPSSSARWPVVRRVRVAISTPRWLAMPVAEIVDATYAAQATLGREINPKVMSASEWQAKKAERNAFFRTC